MPVGLVSFGVQQAVVKSKRAVERKVG